MALSLNLHSIYGELTYTQVDANWTQIETQFNALQYSFETQIPPNNLTANADPGLTDDSSKGWAALSRWRNGVTGDWFLLVDPTVDNAEWIPLDVGDIESVVGSAAFAELGIGPNDVPQNSDLGSMAYESAANYVMSSVTITSGAGLTGGGDLTQDRTISIDVASNADLRAGTAEKMPDAAGLYSANAVVTSSGSGAWTIDLHAGRNFQRTVTGDTTMPNPSNAVAGQSGLIYIIMDGTGGWTFDTWGTSWEFVGGEPVISDTANAITVLGYNVRTATDITVFYSGVIL